MTSDVIKFIRKKLLITTLVISKKIINKRNKTDSNNYNKKVKKPQLTLVKF